MAQLIMAEGATPATPSTGKATIFINANGILCWVDDAGNVYAVAYNNQTITFSNTITFTGSVTLNKVIYGQGAALTIAGGVITVTHSRHSIDTEAAAATDDLDTINGGVTNMRLVVNTVSSARDVTLKHATGNILNASGADVTLTASTLRREYIYDGSVWREIG